MLDWCSHNADRPGRSANGRVRGTQDTSLHQRSAVAIPPRSMGRGRVSWCAPRHILDFFPQTADPVFEHWIVNTTDAAPFNGPAMVASKKVSRIVNCIEIGRSMPSRRQHVVLREISLFHDPTPLSLSVRARPVKAGLH